MTATLTGPHRPPRSGGRPQQLVVFLHGYGADGADLIGLAPYFGQAFPDAAFEAPDAPEPCGMGFGRQWFALETRTQAEMEQGARRAAPILDAYLDAALVRTGLPPAALALVGFSQGSMMALHVGLRRAEPVAAIVAFSGALVAADSLSREIASRPPVLLVHGEADPVVPFAAMGAAAERLGAAHVPLRTLARPGLGHGIDPDGIQAAIATLRESFAAS